MSTSVPRRIGIAHEMPSFDSTSQRTQHIYLLRQASAAEARQLQGVPAELDTQGLTCTSTAASDPTVAELPTPLVKVRPSACQEYITKRPGIALHCPALPALCTPRGPRGCAVGTVFALPTHMTMESTSLQGPALLTHCTECSTLIVETVKGYQQMLRKRDSC
jgi:hypothetical protein